VSLASCTPCIAHEASMIGLVAMERVQSSLKSIKESCYLCEFLTTRPALSDCNKWWTLSDKFAWHGDRESRKLDSIQQSKMRQSLKTWNRWIIDKNVRRGLLAIRTGWLIDDSGQSIGLELATKTKTYDSILGMDHGKQNKSDDYIIKGTFSWLSWYLVINILF